MGLAVASSALKGLGTELQPNQGDGSEVLAFCKMQLSECNWAWHGLAALLCH